MRRHKDESRFIVGRETLGSAARCIESALALLPPSRIEAAAQEGLDFLALLMGEKPCCLSGRGSDPALSALLHDLSATQGLPVIVGPAWQPAAASGDLPAWYLAATRRQGEAQPCLYLCRDAEVADRVAALCRQGRIAPAAEAALLGYPPCCVVQHHAQTLAYERLLLDMLRRIADGEVVRMERLVAAGALPLPGSAEEWRRYRAVTAITPCPSTSVNMCSDCAIDLDGPAWRLMRRYRMIAEAARYRLIAGAAAGLS